MPDCKFSARVGRIKPSPTTAAATRARELIAEGRPVISLTTGEPDTPTPEFVQEAAIAAMRAGQTRYTNTGGTAELKQAIRHKFRRDNTLDYSDAEVMAATGGKQIIFNALSATVDHGDEVIIGAPYWVSYPDIVQYAGGTPVILPTSAATGFKITPDQLEAAITDRSRWLMLNAPSNPSGAIYSKADLRALAEVLERHRHVWVMCDDMYEHIRYDGAPYHTMAQVAPALKDRVLTVNGVSKAYSMTGWRIGFAGGPAELIKEMTKLQSQSTSSPNAVAQAAAAAALNAPLDAVLANTAALEARRNRLFDALAAIKGLSVTKPEGAFYFFISVAGWLGRRTAAGEILQTDDDVARFLLETHNLALVSGSGFGMSPFVRLSYAASEEKLDKALIALTAAAAELMKDP
ncbi:MAG: pyridoxal phosphate-dependent aminotransferase [Pseudomonadota bacterium]